jgi:hypothetical protein
MAVKDFTNDDDVRQSQEISRQDSGNFINFDLGKTPFYVIKTAYSDGFVHWVTLPNGDRKRVVCVAPLTDKGYNPDVCPICAIVQKQSKEWRSLEDAGQHRRSKALKEKNRQMSSKYEIHLLAAVGEMSRSTKNGKAIIVPDMSEPRVGIISMTKTQKDIFLGLVNSPQYPFMEERTDLFNRVLIASKNKTEVDWSDNEVTLTDYIPMKKPSPVPEVEYDEEELDLDSDFEQDEEQANKVAMLYLGDLEDEDEEVEFEDDDDDAFGFDDEEDEILDDNLDEEDFLEEDEADSEEDDDFDFDDEEEEEEVDFDESFLDDAGDIDFEDDIPWEQDEEEPAIPKEKPSKSSTANQKKSTSGTKKKPTTKQQSKQQSKPSATQKNTSVKSNRSTSVSSSQKKSTAKPSTKSAAKSPNTTEKTGSRQTAGKTTSKKASSKKKTAPKKADL